MNSCNLCEGEVEKKLVNVEREWNGKKIVIKDVPAVVCDDCGKRYFDAETTLKMDNVIPGYVSSFGSWLKVQEG